MLFRIIKKPATPDKYFDTNNPNPSKSLAPHRIFNIGNSKPTQLIDYISAIEKSLGIKAIKEYLPMQPGDVKKTFANIDKAGESLGFVPSTSIEEGVKKFVDWYIEYYER